VDGGGAAQGEGEEGGEEGPGEGLDGGGDVPPGLVWWGVGVGVVGLGWVLGLCGLG